MKMKYGNFEMFPLFCIWNKTSKLRKKFVELSKTEMKTDQKYDELRFSIWLRNQNVILNNADIFIVIFMN